MAFLRYGLIRLITSIPLVVFVLAVSFLLVRLAPGSPLGGESELPGDVRARLEEQYGLHRPLHEQFGLFLINALKGDFGYSLTLKSHKVSDIIAQAFPVSAQLALLSIALAMVAGLFLGIVSARHHGQWLDRFSMVLAVSGKTIPPMVIAPVFVTIMALTFKLLPVQGWGSWQHYVGPVVCLAIYDTAAIARLIRGSFLEILGQPYVRTARAKGLSENLINMKHVLREAILPLVTYLGPALSGLLVGTVVVESLFNVPGLGRYLVSAAQSRDYNLILGISTLATILLILMNTFVDLLLALLDPRIRLS